MVKRNRSPFAVIKKSALWAVSMASLRGSDVIFPCFPKVGSTWVRIVVWHMYQMKSGHVPDSFTFDQLDREMPELGTAACMKQWSFGELPRLLKTHKTYLPFYGSRRVVLMTRDPLDTMKSLHAYLRADQQYNYQGSLDDLVNDPVFGLEAFFRYYNHWRPRAACMLRYEDMQDDPIGACANLFSLLNVSCEEGEIEKALALSSKERTRQAQKDSSAAYRSQFSEAFHFARKTSSSEELNFSEESLALCQMLREKYDYPDSPESGAVTSK